MQMADQVCGSLHHHQVVEGNQSHQMHAIWQNHSWTDNSHTSKFQILATGGAIKT